MLLIRWIKPDGSSKYHVMVVGQGKMETLVVDGIVVDSGSNIAVSGADTTRGWITTSVPCRVVELEVLPGIKEKILACTRKTVSELKELVKLT